MDRRGQLASFTGIPCFWTELSWSYNQKQTYGAGEEKSFKKWGGWTASAGSRIYKSGGHKIMDFLSITKTSRWEVVKNSASPKRPFFFFFLDFLPFFPFCKHFQSKSIHFLALPIYFSNALLSSSVCFSNKLSIV